MTHHKRIRQLKQRYNIDLNYLENFYKLDNINISLSTINDETELLKIKHFRNNVSESDYKIIKSIFYNNLLQCNNIYIPYELNQIILDYYQPYDYISLKFNINFSWDYPFKSPNWIFIDAITNTGLENKNNIIKFFQDKVETHNSMLSKNWCAIIYIEKDILQFITNVYESFEYFYPANPV